jgi:hypothetical protein
MARSIALLADNELLLRRSPTEPSSWRWYRTTGCQVTWSVASDPQSIRQKIVVAAQDSLDVNRGAGRGIGIGSASGQHTDQLNLARSSVTRLIATS